MSQDNPNRNRLALAACTLLAAGNPAAQANDQNWEVDTSYLSYSESDSRVSVSKSLASLVRQGVSDSLSVSLVHDTMSGASPTGALRSSESAVTFTGVSGGGFSASGTGDYSKSYFEDTRTQAGINYQHDLGRDLQISYGGVVSQESDYDSMGGNLGLQRESKDKLTSFNLGIAVTADTIYRSDTGGTPQPLSNTDSQRLFTKGKRSTVDTLVGMTRVLNKRTLAQVNLTFSQSDGYHSDPYKIISAADTQDRIVANFYDSRPSSRARTSLQTKLVHQLAESDHALHLSYRFYRDDWGLAAHTGDLRFRYQISQRQYLEPHIRVYWQSDADFYQRHLDVGDGATPLLPESGFVSADYRLDSLSSTTVGLKYGLSLTPVTRLRLRAEYLSQRFASAEYGRLGALILQASLRFRFK